MIIPRPLSTHSGGARPKLLARQVTHRKFGERVYVGNESRRQLYCQQCQSALRFIAKCHEPVELEEAYNEYLLCD